MKKRIDRKTIMIKKMVKQALAEAYGEHNKVDKQADSSGVLRIAINQTDNPGNAEHAEGQTCYTDILTSKESKKLKAGIIEINKGVTDWMFSADSLGYIVEGKINVLVNGKIFAVETGDIIFVPGRIQTQISSTEKARLIYIAAQY